MKNSIIVKLVSIGKVKHTNLRKLAVLKYNNMKISSEQTLVLDILSKYNKINVLLQENNGKYYEISTGKEIFLDLNNSFNEGYITVPTKEMTYSLNKEEIEGFLSQCKTRKLLVDAKVNTYIYEVLSNDSYVVSNMNKLSENNILFKWAYIYNLKTKKYERFALPYKDDELSINDIYFDKKALIDFTKDIKGSNIGNFELVSSVYELLSKIDYVDKKNKKLALTKK